MDSGRKTPSTPNDIHWSEFAFYYNCAQARTPAISEPSIGQGIGISGIFIALADKNGKPVVELSPLTRVDSEIGNHESVIKNLFNQNQPLTSLYEKLDQSGVESSYNLLIEMWSQGPLNSDALIEKIKKSFQQTLYDYFIELSIIKGLPANDSSVKIPPLPEIIDNDEFSQPQNQLEGLESRVQKTFVEPSLTILQESADCQNPSVHSLEMSADMPSWVMEDLLQEICELLTEVHTNFAPIILRREASSGSEEQYEIYRPTRYSLQSEVAIAKKYFLISGLRELSIRYSALKFGNTEERRSSLGSDLTGSRRSSIDDFSLIETLSASNDKIGTNHSRKSSLMTLTTTQKCPFEDVMLYTNESIDQYNHPSQDINRSCFLIMSIDGFHMKVFTYNWQKTYSEQIFDGLKRISNWHNGRMQLLNNILHQKMGLFYHIGGVSPNHTVPAQMQFPSTPHTPRILPSPMLGTGGFSGGPKIPLENLLKSQQNQKSNTVNQNTTDLTYVKSLIHERFPQRQQRFEARSDDAKKGIAASLEGRNEGTNSHAVESEKSTNVLLAMGEFNELLKDAFIEKNNEHGIFGDERDALLRHGPPFIEACIRQTKISQAHENALKVYEKWAKRYQDSKDFSEDQEQISSSDLKIIFRTSRILHFCRTPLFFSKNYHPVSSQDHQLQPKNETLFHWYQTIVESFLRKYASYLENLGMQVVMFGKTDSNLVDKFFISETITVDCPAVFLLKALQSGSIMCEVRIQETFVCVTLYTLNRRYGRLCVAAPGFESVDVDRQSLKAFTEECGRFKKLIHVNSFVYDFHLEYLIKILETPKETPPSFNVLQLIRAFVDRHPKPASYAKHPIYHSYFDEVSQELFNYIVKNPQRYNFRGIYFDGEPIACFADLCKASKTQHTKAIEDMQYTLIFTLTDPKSNSEKLALEYFIVGIEPGDKRIPPKHLPGAPSQHGFERPSRNEVPCDIVGQAKEILTTIIDKAIEYNDRDNRWRQLSSGKTNSPINIDDFLKLTQKWYARELTSINPDFRQFLDVHLNWGEVLTFLSQYYPGDARELFEDHKRHLIIFNPHNHDLLLQFILDADDGKLIVNSVCREAMPNFEGFEIQFAGDIARTIGYLLWQKLCLGIR